MFKVNKKLAILICITLLFQLIPLPVLIKGFNTDGIKINSVVKINETDNSPITDPTPDPTPITVPDLTQAPPANVVGANVDESKATYVLYVDNQNPNASDNTSNIGTTIEQPLKTIQRAVNIAIKKNNENIGVKIVIYPGTYRENVRMVPNTQTSAPIVIEAKEKGTVVVSGSQVYSNWQQESGSNLYSHQWDHDFGFAVNIYEGMGNPDQTTIAPLGLRTEMFFIDGEPLTQVLTYEELADGKFYVDETADKVYVMLFEGTDMSSAKIEAAIERELFRSTKSDLVVRGITFQHSRSVTSQSHPSNAVSIRSERNVLIEECTFQYNNWSGFGVSPTNDITIRGNVANYNGATGMGGSRLRNIVWEDNETSYNNWRGYQGGFTAWAVAGTKVLQVHDGIFRNHLSRDNMAHGFWFDTDFENIWVDGFVSFNNLTFGIQVENFDGDFILQNSVIYNNGKSGLHGNTVRNIKVFNNIIYGNTNMQISASGWSRGRDKINFVTYESTTVYLGNWNVSGNIIVGTDATQKLHDQEYSDSETWHNYIGSLTADYNPFYRPDDDKAFKRTFSTYVTLEDWKRVWEVDLNSRWLDPGQLPAPTSAPYNPDDQNGGGSTPDPTPARTPGATPDQAADNAQIIETGIRMINGDEVILASRKAPELTSTVRQKSAAMGVTALVEPIEFKVEALADDGTRIELLDSRFYISREIELDRIIDDAKATGVLYNPDTKQMIPVPTVFSIVDGKSVATIKHWGSGIYTVISSDKTFEDVKEHWARQEIETLASKLIIKGKWDQEFEPEGKITRAELATLFVRGLGFSGTDIEGDRSFADVTNQWFVNDVKIAADIGIVSGYGGRFRPDDPVTREEMMIIAVNVLNIVGKPVNLNNGNEILEEFTDSTQLHEWSKNAVVRALHIGIVQGNGKGQLKPSDTTTRAEAATVILRVLSHIEFR